MTGMTRTTARASPAPNSADSAQGTQVEARLEMQDLLGNAAVASMLGPEAESATPSPPTPEGEEQGAVTEAPVDDLEMSTEDGDGDGGQSVEPGPDRGHATPQVDEQPDTVVQASGDRSGQSVADALKIVEECKTALGYQQVVLAKQSGPMQQQQKFTWFQLDWRYAIDEHYAKISRSNLTNPTVRAGFKKIRNAMSWFEARYMSKQKDKNWLTDTVSERIISLLKQWGFRFKRAPVQGTLTAWGPDGAVHFKHITNEQLKKAGPAMLEWARKNGFGKVSKTHKLGLTTTNVAADATRLRGIQGTTTRWRNDIKASKAICAQIIKTFDSKTGLFTARDGWERKVLTDVTFDKDTRFVHVLRSYTKARTKADAKAVYIGVQPFAWKDSLTGGENMSKEDARKVFEALGLN